MTIVYVSIGNSDDKLSQAEWANFIRSVGHTLRFLDDVHIHGYWLSSPESSYQNACWCVEFESDDLNAVQTTREDLRALGRRFRQDSIAWAEVKETEFL